MTKHFVYDDYFNDFSSEVISGVWFNEKTMELLTSTVSGNAYVYRNVSNNTFQRFRDSKSRGAFWNHEIKYHHLSANWNGVRSEDVVITPRDSTDVTHEPENPFNTFEVVVELNGTLVVKGSAASANEALEKARKVLEDADFKGEYKIRELKQKFV